jgi:hypothetical protein
MRQRRNSEVTNWRTAQLGCLPQSLRPLTTATHVISAKKIFSRVGVTIKTGFELDDWIYCTLYNLTVPSYNSSARTPRKTPSSVVKNVCLPVSYLTKDFLLWLSSYATQDCLPTRCLATGIHVTILYVFK